MEGARTMPRRGGRSVSVRRDKSAREVNRPAMGAHSFDGARSAAQISILHRYTTQCGERLRAVVRDSIPIVPLDRSIDRSLLVRVKERRGEGHGGGTICRIVGCLVRALAPHHHRKRRRRAGRGGEGAQKIGR